MNKQQIECFLEISITGSLTKAAKNLYLTPQGVSRHIHNLEKELGFSLFYRNRTGMELTAQGLQFYEDAVQWSELYNTTMQKIEEYYYAIGTSLSIGISEYVNIMGEISKGIADFRDQYPDILMTGLQYNNKILFEKVESGDLDVAIMNEQQIFSGGDFAVRPFAREDLRLFISGYRSDTLQPDLKDQDLIALCKNLPHVSSSYGVWDRGNWEEISHRVTSFLGYDFTKHYEAANFRSVILNLEILPCSAVSDVRFGYIPDNDRFFNIPLQVESHLCCLWRKKNENPLIADFVGFLDDYYN